MIADSFTKLADSIQRSAIPEWLVIYFQEHKNEVVFDLKVFGSHEINCPDGSVIRVAACDPPARSGENT